MPYATVEWWESACFHLGWVQHGGSGLGRSISDILEMPVDHIIRDVARVSERRKLEYEAMRKKQ